jgi:hypothetical protein
MASHLLGGSICKINFPWARLFDTLPVPVGEDIASPETKPRHNVVYFSADISRPYRFIVTPHMCLCGLSPGGRLVLARCRVVAGAAGLDSTRSRACRTEVKIMLTRAERSRMGWNARGADTPGAFGCVA